ncbi:UpxY family transcription antiterminator [Pseudoalteromonas sp. OOF1S-7]|uniref:UpxY family transcription antiterminator n=1 Tax=Pseudoalteromonas sp. OOF1S-7 TaxID=2917757 RepID=UPI001EF5DAD1|nr:UpxY family transcription antiterminator [Pseudoalteromonas sp. OOF1S-7]MCG7537083.1 UpxY family transcription antiterminator [Pseudoalteromonas sp. OOF1S-7]
MFDDRKKWFQIYTQPNAEKRLNTKLEALGTTSYLPLRKITRQWSDRVKVIEEPAFKSYLFAKLLPEEMRSVERLSEFGFFVSYGGSNNGHGKVFPTITDQDIEQIEAVLQAFPEALMYEDKQLKKDAQVVIREGSLKGYRGALLADATDNKVALALQGLSQSLVITVPVEFLDIEPQAQA